MMDETPTLLTVKGFSAKYPAVTTKMIYKAAYYARRTGIVECGALLRLSDRGKWLVDEYKMLEFMRSYSRKLVKAKPDPDGENRPAWATK